eukprot:TRINITY_DN8608_c0_g1_i1.p1 TRINITY_DN8608_c0_g1~~TRINITY_DN8608_c0_g1_i1.p1  ORF type:complete len:222 (+),score=118.46 TRINITY_DN8608_c0_g1_i1:81-746(+)
MLRLIPSAARAVARPQLRWYESTPTDIKQIKKGDYIDHEGIIHKVDRAETKNYGRSAAQGYMRAVPVSGPQRGESVSLSGMKYNKVDVTRAQAMFDHVNEEKDVLVLQYYKRNDDLETSATGEFFELDGETFEGLIKDGEGCLKWLTAEQQLQVYRCDEDIIELKMPNTHAFTAANVSQVGGKFLCLLDENDEQVYVDSPNIKPGDAISIGLPKGLVLKKK